MMYFFEQVSVLLPALGVEIFAPRELDRRVLENQAVSADGASLGTFDRRSPRRSDIPVTGGAKTIDVMLRDGKFGIEAHGIESNGEIIVLTGSQARGVSESLTNIYRPLRERLIKEGKIAHTGSDQVLEFKSDVLFNSPSAASAVILDRNDNGRNSWKERSSNKTLNEWYAEQANLVSQPVSVGEN
jgi:hypothetical protein